MSAAFQAAAAPRRFRVLGLELHTLCIGHWMLMEAHRCAISTGAKPEMADLICSTLICARKPTLFRENPRLFIWFWRRRIRNAVAPLEHQKFESYISYHKQFPAVSIKPGGREMGTPEHWRLLTMLMSEFGMSKSEALDTPWLFANCLWAAEGERTNAFSVVPSETCEAMAKLKALS